ncbi:MAG: ATP-binding protein [Deltaproteobacteria bacterium]|nr:ATP-binding protein [Deltaproteobacteria bacterium]
MTLAYNPALLDVEELVRGFVARGQLLDQILDDLRQGRRVHRLLVGQRGMGKTTLLRRVAAEVARDPALAERWTALAFPEEQYNVVTLSDFCANCLDAAADGLQMAGDHEGADRIDATLRALPAAEDARATYALDHLLALAGAGKRLLLCVDNLQQVLGRLQEHEQWSLRRVMSETDRLALLGASPALPEPSVDYGAAFYDFLQVTRLDALDFDEAVGMLDALAEQAGAEDLRALLKSRPARLHALFVLAGGNPRTVVMLFDLLRVAPGEDTHRMLEHLVDRATPLYKARFEELAEQAQVVLGALALHWHPATAAQLADATRLDVNTVSTQLTRLHREGLVLKVDIAGEARTGFLVAERFFNIWYLMRASRRSRGRVLGFARCLEAIYDGDGLRGLALRALASAIPAREAPELLAEPDDLQYRGRVEENRRRLEEFTRVAAGLDTSGLGAPPEDAVVSLAEPRESGPTALTDAIHASVSAGLLDAATRANRSRETYLPLAIAIDVAVAKDASLLSRYAPEVQTAARKLLDDLWPEHAELPPPAGPTSRRKPTRRSRRC